VASGLFPSLVINSNLGILNPRKKPCDLDNRSTTSEPFMTLETSAATPALVTFPSLSSIKVFFDPKPHLSYNENLPVGPNTKSANAVQDHVPVVLQ
ncbi:hypothetical protein FCULG_00000810, partial [Fusarium culmorum]